VRSVCSIDFHGTVANNGGAGIGRDIFISPLNGGLGGTSPLSRSGFYSMINNVQLTTGMFLLWRVVSSRLTITVKNEEAFPVEVMIPVLNSTSRTVITGNNYLVSSLRVIPGCRWKVANKTGVTGDIVTMTLSANTQNVEGPQDVTVGYYQGNYNTNPARTLSYYLQITAADGASLFTAAGVNVSYKLDILLDYLHSNQTLDG